MSNNNFDDNFSGEWATRIEELTRRLERLEALEYGKLITADGRIIAGAKDHLVGGNWSGVFVGFDNQVGAANNSVILGGLSGRIGASANDSAIIGGVDCILDGAESVLVGGAHHNAQASFCGILAGDYNETTNAADNGVILGGVRGKAYLRGQRVTAGGRFSNTGDAQISDLVLRLSTTDATPTNLEIHGGYKMILPTNTAWHCWIEILARKSGGTDHAAFVRRCVIERTVNATALVGSVQTIGTDIASGGAGAWAVAITADDTNEALQVQVTGQTATNIRWVAWVRMVEVGYS